MIIVCYQDAGGFTWLLSFLYFPNFLLMIYSAIKIYSLVDAMIRKQDQVSQEG